jgi:hypothetical protein
MMILAAMLPSGQALPLVDRTWLNEQVRLEAVAFRKPTRPPLKLTLPASDSSDLKLRIFDNTNGM